GPSAPFCFVVSSGATSSDQRLRCRPSGVKLPEGDRSMTRSRVFIMRSRSDQNREIESRDDNVSTRERAQSRKETEFFELKREPSVERIRRCVLTVATGVLFASCVAKQMQLSTRRLKTR